MRAIVTVAGKDKTGIIATVSTILSENHANILDISQTILQEYFVMMMLVDLSQLSGADFVELQSLLKEKGAEVGVDIRIQREDIFDAMHRI